MRFRDWYFQGWERRTDENGKSGFVYTGEYYIFPGGIASAKKICLTLSLALIVCYAAAAFFPSPGGMWHFAAIPQLLELIPLIYIVIGLTRLLLSKEPLTYRDYHASWRRLRTAAIGSAVLTACMALTELVYLVLYARSDILPEIPFFLAECACFSLSFALTSYIKKHPCAQSIGT